LAVLGTQVGDTVGVEVVTVVRVVETVAEVVTVIVVVEVGAVAKTDVVEVEIERQSIPRRCEMQGRGLRKTGLGTLVPAFELLLLWQ
jgi:hypothetical protein